MGVIACDRDSCENIMCDVTVDGKWNICDDCIREFKEFLKDRGLQPKKDEDIIILISFFMDTSPHTYEQKEIPPEVDEFFNSRRRSNSW